VDFNVRRALVSFLLNAPQRIILNPFIFLKGYAAQLLISLLLMALLAAGLSGCASYERRQLYPPLPDQPAEAEDETLPPPGLEASAAEPDEGTEIEEEVLTPPVERNIIRVLLFENAPGDSIRVLGQEAALVLTDDEGRRYDLPAEQTAGIRRLPGDEGIALSSAGRTFVSSGWQLETEDGSAFTLVHPQQGWRRYKGRLHLDAAEDGLRIINHVHLEAYVGSVTGSEMNFSNPEALKVQAVISRTYALWNSYLNNRDGGQDYDVSDHVMDQVYDGHHANQPRFEAAARATAGEILTWSGGLILAAYHSTCGGRTSHNESVWSGQALPYLRQVSDGASCAASPHYSWNFSLPDSQVYELFGVDEITGLETDSGGRVAEVITRRGEQEERIGANVFRLRLNQRYGTFTLRSAYFELTDRNGHYEFTGHGLGHGVGLCQWGALGFAESGWDYQDILRFYYKGVEITRLSSFETSGFRLARY
jgi:stage II sporulation protein D